MRLIFGRVITLVEYWSMLLLILLVAVVSLGVFFRYVLGASLAWYDEFASYLLVWLTFSGAVVAFSRQRHIAFDLLTGRLKPRVRKIAELTGEFFVLGFNAVLFYYGWTLTERMGDETAVSLPWVRMAWVYSVMPIAGGLMLLISCERLFDLVIGNGTGKGAGAPWSGSSSE